MSEIKPASIKTAQERFQAYMKAKGISLSSSLVHINKISQFEEQERKELRAAYEALQKENAELKHINLTSLADLHFKNRELEDKNAEQAKRIEEHLELIEATAEFSKAFWEKADKHSDTRVMVSTFQQLERKLRTYLPASKNGE